MTKLFAEEATELKEPTSQILNTIKEKWPTNPLEVAKELGDSGKPKTLSAKYLYHFKKLHSLELIHLKKVGNTHIAWPADIEKLRLVHEMVSEGD